MTEEDKATAMVLTMKGKCDGTEKNTADKSSWFFFPCLVHSYNLVVNNDAKIHLKLLIPLMLFKNYKFFYTHQRNFGIL